MKTECINSQPWIIVLMNPFDKSCWHSDCMMVYSELTAGPLSSALGLEGLPPRCQRHRTARQSEIHLRTSSTLYLSILVYHLQTHMKNSAPIPSFPAGSLGGLDELLAAAIKRHV